MKHFSLTLISAGIGLFILGVSGRSPVYAVATVADESPFSSQHRDQNIPGEVQDTTNPLLLKKTLEVKLQEKIRDRDESNKELIDPKVKLDQNKLKLCTVKQKIITNRTQSLTKYSENMIRVFDAIAAKVESFYEAKVKDGMDKIDNYDELTSAIEDNKKLAENSLDNAKTLSAFDCATVDPKGQMEAFRVAMQEVKSDLKDYRTSIKDLIVAVKTAAGTEENQEQEQEQEKNKGETKNNQEENNNENVNTEEE